MGPNLAAADPRYDGVPGQRIRPGGAVYMLARAHAMLTKAGYGDAVCSCDGNRLMAVGNKGFGSVHAPRAVRDRSRLNQTPLGLTGKSLWAVLGGVSAIRGAPGRDDEPV
jgi:hypothetical protein